MKTFFSSVTPNSNMSAGKNPDVVLAAGVIGILALLIVPVPGFVMDGLIATNIALASVVLLVTLFSTESLKVSSFPTILLITTVFRLALNVSTTRLILAKGKAGAIVESFGEFVAAGDLVVGMVMFLVITIVQFLVIGKGAERVAEVAARFTLDAMPGKQMSIDADLRNGAISDEEAQQKRESLSRESQLYGAMDGAMKFVKGDAIAGLIITGLNLVAGLIIGISRLGMSFADAAQTYSVLTIGDGLVSQVPALLITLSAGIMTTRVAPEDTRDNLGHVLKWQLFSNPKVLGVAAGFSALMGFVPGMPTIPFVCIAAVLCSLMLKRMAGGGEDYARFEGEPTFEQTLEAKVQQAKAQQSAVDNVAPAVVPLCIEVDPALTAALGLDPQADAGSELISELIPQVRDALYSETGVRFPGVRVRANVRGLPERSFRILLKDVPVCESQLRVDGLLVMESADRVARCGVEVEKCEHPIRSGEASFVDFKAAEVLESMGLTAWNPSGVLALSLVKVLRKHTRAFVGLQEVSELMDRLEKAYPALVREVVPKVVTLQQLVDVLRRLVDERVSIRDLKSILEALADGASYETDGVILTELVRASLSMQIAHSHAGMGGEISVVLIDPVIEDTIRSSIQYNNGGSYLAMEPEISRSIIDAVVHSVAPVVKAGTQPVILTTNTIRRYFRKLIEAELPEVSVLSFEELPGELSIQPLGQVGI
jgi:type III secretion protein V